MSKDARIYCSQGPDTLPATAQGTLSGTRFVFKDLFDVEATPQALAIQPG